MSSRSTHDHAGSRSECLSLPRKCGAILASALMASLLAGCAAQLVFRDGKELVAQGKVEEGLRKFQEASRQDPRSAEYRTAYFQTRDRAIASYLEQGDRLAVAGKRADAEQRFRRVLAIDPGNIRARDGLRNLDLEARHARLLKEAAAALEAKDAESAQLKIAAILTENPEHPGARALSGAIAEKAARPPVEAQLAAAYKKPISIEFKDVALKQIFEVISRSSGLNFLFDKDVKTDQKTSIFLKNSNIESVVFYTLMTNQLEQQILDANTILIYPNTVAKQKDYQEMLIQSFFLTNADVKTVANTLKTILKSRDVVIDEKLNMLIVRDTPEALKLAEKLVALHDVAEPEVMLEVEILEVKRTKLLELGIKWPDTMTLTPLSSLAAGGLTLNDLRHQNSGTLGVSTPSVTANARKDDSDANLLANPRIRARNHEKAKILIGERVPNITTTATSTGFVSESINYVDVGLKLDVEPTIYLDNDVAIKVSLEVSNIVSQLLTKSGTVAYQIGTRTASTVLRLKDGETQVLAGLINDEDRRSASKIPVLGDIPLLGRLFGSAADDVQKTEIVLSITPRLVRNIQRPEAAAAQFRAGTETSLRQRPDAGGRGATVTAAALAGPVSAARQAAAPKPAPAADAGAASAPASNAASHADNANEVAVPGAAPGAVPVAVPADDPGSDPAAPLNLAHVNWKGPAQSRVGSNFSVQLTMQSDEPIGSLPITVGFDSKVLEVVRVVEGDFLKQGGAQAVFSNQVDPKGQILMTGTRSGGEGGAAAGTVATVTFRSLTASEGSNIEVLAAAPVGASGRVVNIALPAAQTVRVQP
jgi:general secretion pathway protein D